MWTSTAAVESLGFEHASHDICWEQEHIELHSRNNLSQRQRCDRMQELSQYLDCKLRERNKEVKRLKKENDALKNENIRFKNEAKEQNMALLSFAPLALHEASDCSLRHAGFMLPKFNGTDPTNFAESWLKMICDSSALYSWSESQTFLAAKMTLAGEARHWLVALRRDINNFHDFKVAFTKKYHKKETSVAKIHLELAKRKRIKGEAVNDYLMDMKHLAKKINFDEEMTIEYIILGLGDETFPKSTLEQFTTLAEIEEYLMEHVDEVRVPNIVEDANAKECYHCNKTGHVYAECKEVIESNIAALFLVSVLLAIMGV